MTAKKKKKKEEKPVVKKKLGVQIVTFDINEKIIKKLDILSEDDLRSRSNYMTFVLHRYIKMRERKTPGISAM